VTGARAFSIRTRVFVLALAALAIAQAIGLMLMLTSPPPRNAPVSLPTLARALASPIPPATPAFAPAGRSAPREYRVFATVQPPAPPEDLDADEAADVRRELARMLDTGPDALVVHVRRGHVLRPRPGEPSTDLQLGEGFRVAWRQSDGTWRVVESVVPGFPTPFQRQMLLLLAVGLALLLPLAWLVATTLAAPIRRFADAAELVGRDSAAPPLPVDGPAEMRQAAAAFNAMQQRIRRLLEERTEMVAAIAHDLRTPLARLAFRLEALPDDARRKAASDIDEMTTMIAATLDFTRDRARAPVRELLDLRLLAEAVANDYADVGRDVTIEPAAPVHVHGDAAALRRAIGNLVDNALKYGHRARIEVATQGTRALLSVDDDGPGIPESLQARAFRPFTRLEESRNRGTGGVGLGLTVVRATVLDHGGEVSLVNRVEGGLRAEFSLPLQRVAASERSA
jgi:signal transduction histidine kinase